MAETCGHLDDVTAFTPSSEGGEDCLRTRDRGVHRLCMHCGNIGCCDSSPNGTPPLTTTPTPITSSYEPGENWWWCYADESALEIDAAPPSPSHATRSHPMKPEQSRAGAAPSTSHLAGRIAVTDVEIHAP